MDDVIAASDLLQQHLQVLQVEFTRQAQQAIRSEAETRDIDTDKYAFDQNIGAFVKQREDDVE